MRTHRQKLPSAYLASPPPPWWRADGGDEGNQNAASAAERGGVNPSDSYTKWFHFMEVLHELGVEVFVVPHAPRPLFDTTFMRDTCIYVPERGYVMSQMRAKHRMGEPAYVEQFLRDELGQRIHGYMPCVFEGDSCFFMLPNMTRIIFGHGSRADKEAAEVLQDLFGLPVTSLELKEEFFHLDVAASVLASRSPAVLACKDAFTDEESWKRLGEACHEDESALVEVNLEDALNFATNILDIDGTVIVPPKMSEVHQMKVRALGYELCKVDLGDMLDKGGGFAACATNHFSEALSAVAPLEKYRWIYLREQLTALVEKYPTEEMPL